MTFSIEQANRDGWTVEVRVGGSWYECRYYGTFRDGNPMVVRLHTDSGRETPSVVFPEHIRNLQPKKVKVPVQLHASYEGTVRATEPWQPGWIHNRPSDAVVAVHGIRELDEWKMREIKRAGYSPETGQPLEQSECEHDWTIQSLGEKFVDYCRKCGQAKETA